MGTSDKVLMDEIDGVIIKLENPAPGICLSHDVLAQGVKVLLKIQRITLSGKENGNSIKIGNITISGGLAVTAATVGYLILKVHGVI